MADISSKGAVGVSGAGSSVPPTDEQMWAEVLKSIRDEKTPPLHILRQLRMALHDKDRGNRLSLPIALKLVESKDSSGNIIAHGEEAWNLLRQWMAGLSIDESEVARRAGQMNQSQQSEETRLDNSRVPEYVPPEADQGAECHYDGDAKKPTPSAGSAGDVDPLAAAVRQFVDLRGGGNKGGGTPPATPAGGGSTPASPGSGPKTSASAIKIDVDFITTAFEGLISYLFGSAHTAAVHDKGNVISGFIDSKETSAADYWTYTSATDFPFQPVMNSTDMGIYASLAPSQAAMGSTISMLPALHMTSVMK